MGSGVERGVTTVTLRYGVETCAPRQLVPLNGGRQIIQMRDNPPTTGNARQLTALGLTLCSLLTELITLVETKAGGSVAGRFRLEKRRGVTDRQNQKITGKFGQRTISREILS